MEKIEPPKPKANAGRKRGEPQKRTLSLETKAKISARQVLKEQNKKIAKAQSKIVNAQKRKETVHKVDNALKGKNSIR